MIIAFFICISLEFAPFVPMGNKAELVQLIQ